MHLGSRLSAIILIFFFAFLMNLFFGYLRKKTRKFSLKWFLCIHLPIPFIFLARVSFNINYMYIPIFLVAAVAGQILGGKIEL